MSADLGLTRLQRLFVNLLKRKHLGSLGRHSVVASVLLLLPGLTGCAYKYVLRPPVIRVPLVPDRQQQDEAASALQESLSSLSALVTTDPEHKILSVRRLSSDYRISIKTSIAPDLHIVAPQLDSIAALRLIGIPVPYNFPLGTETANIAESKPTEIDFSEIEDTALDRLALDKLMASGQISRQQALGASLGSSKAVIETNLVTETLLARYAKVLLPSDILPNLLEAVQSDVALRHTYSMTKVGDRWQVEGRLDHPRLVAAAIATLKPSRGKPDRLMPAQKTAVETSLSLGWVDSLPEPTDIYFSTPPVPESITMTKAQARAFLDAELSKSGVSTGFNFPLNRGVGTLTRTEYLDGATSTVFLTPRWAPSVRFSAKLCRLLWDCSIGTSRQFVIVVGHSPAIDAEVGAKPLLADYIRRLQTPPLPKEAPLSGTTCYALVYVYNEHWSGLRDQYLLNQTNNRAQDHLMGAKLDGVLQCR